MYDFRDRDLRLMMAIVLAVFVALVSGMAVSFCERFFANPTKIEQPSRGQR